MSPTNPIATRSQVDQLIHKLTKTSINEHTKVLSTRSVPARHDPFWMFQDKDVEEDTEGSIHPQSKTFGNAAGYQNNKLPQIEAQSARFGVKIQNIRSAKRGIVRRIQSNVDGTALRPRVSHKAEQSWITPPSSPTTFRRMMTADSGNKATSSSSLMKEEQASRSGHFDNSPLPIAGQVPAFKDYSELCKWWTEILNQWVQKKKTFETCQETLRHINLECEQVDADLLLSMPFFAVHLQNLEEERELALRELKNCNDFFDNTRRLMVAACSQIDRFYKRRDPPPRKSVQPKTSISTKNLVYSPKIDKKIMADISTASWYSTEGIPWWLKETSKHFEQSVAMFGDQVQQINDEIREILHVLKDEKRRIDTVILEQQVTDEKLGEELRLVEEYLTDNGRKPLSKNHKAQLDAKESARKKDWQLFEEQIQDDKDVYEMIKQTHNIMLDLFEALIVYQRIGAAFLGLLEKFPALNLRIFNDLNYIAALQTAYDFSVIFNESWIKYSPEVLRKILIEEDLLAEELDVIQKYLKKLCRSSPEILCRLTSIDGFDANMIDYEVNQAAVLCDKVTEPYLGMMKRILKRLTDIKGSSSSS